MIASERRKNASEEFARMLQRARQSEDFDIERAKIEITEQIYRAMELQKVNKAELARRLKKSRAYVTKVLQGNANFTLESLVRIARTLSVRLEIQMLPAHSTWVKAGFVERARLLTPAHPRPVQRLEDFRPAARQVNSVPAVKKASQENIYASFAAAA